MTVNRALHLKAAIRLVVAHRGLRKAAAQVSLTSMPFALPTQHTAATTTAAAATTTTATATTTQQQQQPPTQQPPPVTLSAFARKAFRAATELERALQRFERMAQSDQQAVADIRDAFLQIVPSAKEALAMRAINRRIGDVGHVQVHDAPTIAAAVVPTARKRC